MTTGSPPDLVDLAREVLGVRAVKWSNADKFTLHRIPRYGAGQDSRKGVVESGLSREDLSARVLEAADRSAVEAVARVNWARDSLDVLVARHRKESEAASAAIDERRAEAKRLYNLRARVRDELGVGPGDKEADPPPYAAPAEGVPGRERCRPRHGSCGKTWPHSGGCNASAGPFAGQPYPPGGDDDG
jgi:hypothetical protein